jgi:molybdate transport system ATP-binding protein
VLTVRLNVVRGAFTLDVDFELPGGVSALFGRSAAGKTTILRCLAGLERAPRGLIQVGPHVWQHPDGAFRPTHERGVAYVFQENPLLMHVSVREHLDYAEKRAPERTLPSTEVVTLLGLTRLLERRVPQLSGGERQRVALATALLSSPTVLLMDEPLSGLDEVERNDLLPYIEAVAQRLSIPVVYVSHSLREVARLADYVVWIDQGKVRDQGTPERVFSNLDFARWRGDDAGVVVKVPVSTHDPEYGITTVLSPWGELSLSGCQAAPGAQVRLRILASDVSIAHNIDPNTTIMNQLPVRIAALQPGDSDVLLQLCPRTADEPAMLARVTRLSCERLGLHAGMDAYAWVKAVAVLQ